MSCEKSWDEFDASGLGVLSKVTLPSGRMRALMTCIGEAWTNTGVAFLFTPHSGADTQERWAAIFLCKTDESSEENPSFNWRVCLDIAPDLHSHAIQLGKPIYLKSEDEHFSVLPDDRVGCDKFVQRVCEKQSGKSRNVHSFVLAVEHDLFHQTLLCVRLCSRSLSIFKIDWSDKGVTQHEMVVVSERDDSDNVNLLTSVTVHNCDLMRSPFRRMIRTLDPMFPLDSAVCSSNRVSLDLDFLQEFIDQVRKQRGFCTMTGLDWLLFLQQLSNQDRKAKLPIEVTRTLMHLNCGASTAPDADFATNRAKTMLEKVERRDKPLLMNVFWQRVVPEFERVTVIDHQRLEEQSDDESDIEIERDGDKKKEKEKEKEKDESDSSPRLHGNALDISRLSSCSIQ